MSETKRRLAQLNEPDNDDLIEELFRERHSELPVRYVNARDALRIDERVQALEFENKRLHRRNEESDQMIGALIIALIAVGVGLGVLARKIEKGRSHE